MYGIKILAPTGCQIRLPLVNKRRSILSVLWFDKLIVRAGWIRYSIYIFIEKSRNVYYRFFILLILRMLKQRSLAKSHLDLVFSNQNQSPCRILWNWFCSMAVNSSPGPSLVSSIPPTNTSNLSMSPYNCRVLLNNWKMKRYVTLSASINNNGKHLNKFGGQLIA